MQTTATATFFDELRAECAATLAGSLNHPVVQGIGAGTLPLAAFRAYLEQDYLFLLQYARVQALSVAAAFDRATMIRLSELLHSTLAVEVDALRALYANCDGDPARLDTTAATPICRGYTEHLLTAAARGNLLVTLAAILPCQWGYREIGRALASAGLPADTRYAAWINEYASDDYSALVDWALERFDAAARGASADERELARAAFRESSGWELRFWDVALAAETTAT
jgi:thiaminase (transcriptional activator TenA)